MEKQNVAWIGTGVMGAAQAGKASATLSSSALAA